MEDISHAWKIIFNRLQCIAGDCQIQIQGQFLLAGVQYFIVMPRDSIAYESLKQIWYKLFQFFFVANSLQ